MKDKVWCEDCAHLLVNAVEGWTCTNKLFTVKNVPAVAYMRRETKLDKESVSCFLLNKTGDCPGYQPNLIVAFKRLFKRGKK